MSNYWDNLRKKGKIVDEGVKQLDKQWEKPRIFISKYGELVDEAKKHLDQFLESIKDIHDVIIEDHQPRVNYIADVDRFSDECTNIYEHMEQQVYEIEGLLTEFGYEALPTLNGPKDADSSILNPEMMESLEIKDEYSRDYDISNEVTNEQENLSPNKIKKEVPKFIATPVIKSVASVLKSEMSNKHHLTAFTPSSGYPQEPVYSPYYYKA